jgi:signal peptidase I
MKRSGRVWIDVTLGGCIALFLGFLLKTFVVAAVCVPTGSMKETLLPGDFVVVNKLQRHIRVGDVLVFHPPVGVIASASHEEVLFVKRCIATGGDTVEFRPHAITVNQRSLLLPETAAYWNNPEAGLKKCVGQSIVVPRGSLFLLGDNLSESSDSRMWGCIPEDDVVGSAVAVYWSVNPAHLAGGDQDRLGRIRWERIGKVVR